MLGLLAGLLCLTSLGAGLHLDDHWHRLTLDRSTALPGVSFDDVGLFEFLDGDPARTRALMDLGGMPWWSLEELRAGFWRPLSELTHRLDHRLWPSSAVLAHAHSLAWYVLLVAAAAALYRRLLPSPAVAGLAALLYALDDAHGAAVGWVANRNAVTAALLGVLALIAHDRWRRARSAAAGWAAPTLLLVGLLCGESAVATCAYLAAHALFLDAGPWRRRVAGLAPAATVVASWWTAHHLLGHALYGTGIYVDPGQQPLAFIAAAGERGPLLLAGLLGGAPPSLPMIVPGALTPLWVLGVALTAGLALAAIPLLRRDPAARFFALGTLLALLPVCATFPHERLLLLSSLGTMGLLAQLLHGALGLCRSAIAAGEPPPGLTRPCRRVFAALMVAVHLLLSPLAKLSTSQGMAAVGRVMEEDSASLPAGPAAASLDLVMVTSAVPFFDGYLPILRASRREPLPAHVRVLAPATTEVTVHRPDDHTLEIRPAAGFLSSPMDTLFRGESFPFRPGDVVELTGMQAQVLAVTADGRPAEVAFRFSRPLEDPSLRWYHARDGRHAPFTPPRPGDTVTLPAQPAVSWARLMGRE